MSGLGRENLRIAKTVKLYIGGEFPRTESGRTFTVNRHGSEEVYAHLCRASRKDVRNAVAAAKAAAPGWSARSAYNRGQILYRMAEMLEGKRPEFEELLRDVIGQSSDEATAEIDAAVDAFVYFAGFTDKYQQVTGAVNPVAGPHHNFTTPDPVGVVGLFCSDTTDLGALAAHIAAIIASGNTCVALLDESYAVLLAALAEVFATSDLPNGAVNLLSGHLAELFEPMASHMELQSISFQRSSPELLAKAKAYAAENMKRVVPPVRDPLSLEHLLQFVEYKTVWHPIGV